MSSPNLETANPYSALLLRAVAEIRTYQPSPAEAPHFPPGSFDGLIARLELVAALPPSERFQLEMAAVSHITADSYPMSPSFAPSLSTALDAWQRAARRQRRNQR